jgi:hypothetical protein
MLFIDQPDLDEKIELLLSGSEKAQLGLIGVDWG